MDVQEKSMLAVSDISVFCPEKARLRLWMAFNAGKMYEMIPFMEGRLKKVHGADI